jgi:HPt (histidine-containing phosphotransfer) domain-containing protein
MSIFVKGVLKPPQLINLDNLRILARQNESFIREILEVYLANTPKDLDNMAVAVKDRDWKVIRYYAHKLKSSSFTIGFSEGHQKFETIEQMIRNEEYSDVIDQLFAESLTSCDACLVEVSKELTKYV